MRWVKHNVLWSLMTLAAAYAQAPAPAPPPPPPPPVQPDLTTLIDPNSPLAWQSPPADQRALPASVEAPQQVNVSLKVVEFQTNKGVETGLSAYFAQKIEGRGYARIATPVGNVVNADVTFPTVGTPTVNVFLDRLRISEGNIEAILQALVNENRLFILSRPKVMVLVGSTVPSVIKIVKEIPYEQTSVVGATTAIATTFRPTGVQLKITVPQIIDDDGNWATTEDTYIMLNVEAEVTEEGERIVIALADQTSGKSNAISVPELVTRRMKTSIWVRHGQVLMLGGLYRNTKNKKLATLPWLTQGEDLVVGLAERVVPGNFLASPISTTIGNRSTSDGRRELVFMLKAEAWRPPFTVFEEKGQSEKQDAEKPSPTDVISGVLRDLSQIPQGLADEIIKKEEPPKEGAPGAAKPEAPKK